MTIINKDFYADEIREKYFPNFEHSNDVIARDMFLISHGVRHLVICGYIDGDPATMSRMYRMLSNTIAFSCGGTSAQAIPFVCPDKMTGASCGFASHPWIIETLEWIQNHAEGAHRDRLIGFLLGYHPDAIENDEKWFAGQRWPSLPSNLIMHTAQESKS